MDSTKLIIRDLRLNMGIGIHESEKTAHQPVLVNLVIDVTPPADWRKDAYAQVVCYAKIVDAIKSMAADSHIHLAETFAEMIAGYCLKTGGVTGVTVRVEKTAVLTDTAAVGVEIRRERA